MTERTSFLIYRSVACVPDVADAARGLADAATRRNARLDVSGVLHSFGDRFVQYLEGPDDALGRLFADIRADGRHRDVALLCEGRGRRLFRDWPMTLCDGAGTTLDACLPVGALTDGAGTCADGGAMLAAFRLMSDRMRAPEARRAPGPTGRASARAQAIAIPLGATRRGPVQAPAAFAPTGTAADGRADPN